MAENLKVALIYLYPLENAVAHRTDKYEFVHEEDPTPVLRRGQKFTLALTFSSRGYVKGRDDVRLVFKLGARPDTSKATMAILQVNPAQKSATVSKTDWSVGMLIEGSDSLTLEVFVPPNVAVGNWHLQVQTAVTNSTLPFSVADYHKDIYFLFNPWICEDSVCMPEKRLLDEYILTDVGKIWVGPHGSSRGREWVFGQFDKVVLPAAMLLLERSGMLAYRTGDPINVCRVVSKLVNSNDDDGVVVGRWDGNYEDGTAPSAWTGSVPILEQFLETKMPVPYGQCWVFSGVTTTICRALGIPSRVVTNLVSAHDANCSLTVDKYYGYNNEELDYDPLNPMGEDSVWNYHVWNDVWMARPDLPQGYGGWQAIDATPQETSDGLYQCGPASLEAIKKGQVGFNYDVGFLIASVNADYVRWKEDPNAPSGNGFTRIYCHKYHIGRMILTKQPFLYDPNGDRDREDITTQYKANEGTQDERITLMNAARGLQTARSFFEVPAATEEDVSFDLVDLQRVKVGDPFDIILNISNRSTKTRTIEAVLCASSVFYTGVKANDIIKKTETFTVKPRGSKKLLVTVTAEEYLEKLVEYCNMKIGVIAEVEETNQIWAEEDDFQVIKPIIDIKIPKFIPIKKPITITLKFTNPLKKSLTKCQFQLAGPALGKNQVIPYQNAKPGDLVKLDVPITAQKAGTQTIVVTFSSKELVDVTGTAKVEVFDDE